jgi:hypothetical protein
MRKGLTAIAKQATEKRLTIGKYDFSKNFFSMQKTFAKLKIREFSEPPLKSKMTSGFFQPDRHFELI